MYQTNEFRKNLKIEYEGSLWRIEEAQFVKPGKGVAFEKTKIKNLLMVVRFKSIFVPGIKSVSQMPWMWKCRSYTPMARPGTSWITRPTTKLR